MIQKYLANCFLLMLSWLISRLYSIAVSHPCNACCDDSEHNTEDKEDKVFPIRWDSGTLVGPLRETQKTEILAGYMQGPRTRPIQVPELINIGHYFHYFITVTHYETQVTRLHLNCVFWISARHLFHQSISKKKGLKLGQLRLPMWRLWNKVSFLCTLPKKKILSYPICKSQNLTRWHVWRITMRNVYKYQYKYLLTDSLVCLCWSYRDISSNSVDIITHFQKIGKRRL